MACLQPDFVVSSKQHVLPSDATLQQSLSCSSCTHAPVNNWALQGTAWMGEADMCNPLVLPRTMHRQSSCAPCTTNCKGMMTTWRLLLMAEPPTSFLLALCCMRCWLARSPSNPGTSTMTSAFHHPSQSPLLTDGWSTMQSCVYTMSGCVPISPASKSRQSVSAPGTTPVSA